MAADDDDSKWGRQLLVALGALVAISLIIGSVIAVVALGAAKVSGIGGTGARASSTPSLFIPPLSATASDVGPSGGGSPTGSAPSPTSTHPSRPSSGSASPSRTAKPKPAITLRASPTRVSSSQRINFRGSYRRDGRLLQVQRYEGGHWADFPTTATVRGGTFTTYIFTGRSGLNRFRVVDQASGQASNTVRVTVR